MSANYADTESSNSKHLQRLQIGSADMGADMEGGWHLPSMRALSRLTDDDSGLLGLRFATV
jgi:hypothetical protein